jgi:hypothetical protein
MRAYRLVGQEVPLVGRLTDTNSWRVWRDADGRRQERHEVDGVVIYDSTIHADWRRRKRQMRKLSKLLRAQGRK